MNKNSTDFKDQVFKLVKLIPEGFVTTYSQIAKACNRPKSYRAVGNILKTNRHYYGGELPMIPCHRVIKANGEVGGFKGQTDGHEKILILKAEGIEIIDGKVNNAKYYFTYI